MAELILRILHHDGVVEERRLADGSWPIGRSRDNWLCPLDTALSRRHAVLRVEGGVVSVEALQTPNGTLVNDERISTPIGVDVGDEILLGRTVLQLCEPQASAEDQRDQPTADLGRARAAAGLEIVARSQVMREVVAAAERFASSHLPVLITGESGTGKELLARHIHALSGRSSGPFAVLNCPALPSSLADSELFGVEAGVATGVTPRHGRLEQADGGTLLLDEVADLAPEAQAKLLRFLQDGILERVGGRQPIRVDVRVLAATNRPLDPLPPSFRSDLFYRIASLRLHIPPLRERPDDVAPLAEFFLGRSGAGALTLEPEVHRALVAYRYRGNVRELQAIVDRAVLLARGERITVEDLGLPAPEPVGECNDRGQAWILLDAVVRGDSDFWDEVYRPFVDRELPRQVVRQLVALGLEQSGGTVKGLARHLGVESSYRKLLDFLRNNRLLPDPDGVE